MFRRTTLLSNFALALTAGFFLADLLFIGVQHRELVGRGAARRSTAWHGMGAGLCVGQLIVRRKCPCSCLESIFLVGGWGGGGEGGWYLPTSN